MNIDPATLLAQAKQALAQWPFITEIENANGLLPHTLLAVGSRETNLTDEVGDGGHGHGVWQLDDRSHQIPDPYTVEQQAKDAAEHLKGSYNQYQDWVSSYNAYNSGGPNTGSTTGGDYGPDVQERQAYLASQDLGTAGGSTAGGTPAASDSGAGSAASDSGAGPAGAPNQFGPTISNPYGPSPDFSSLGGLSQTFLTGTSQIMSVANDNPVANLTAALARGASTAIGDVSTAVDAFGNRFYHSKQVAASPTKAEIDKDPMLAFGRGYTSAVGQPNTADLLKQTIDKNTRAYEPPATVHDWECRIGGSKFYIPPTSLVVAKSFRSGSLATGAIRQGSPPKFNTGHSETTISMTLFFPNYESVWGFAGGNRKRLEIDFDKDNYKIIDSFTSSLRGFIAQFKYAPFLPVANGYLNRVHNIKAVALESMSISTMENFPFAMRVEVHMIKFNHKVYLPMVENFDSAIHWGRFRQYIGRAATKLERLANQAFLTSNANPLTNPPQLNPSKVNGRNAPKAPDPTAPANSKPTASSVDNVLKADPKNLDLSLNLLNESIDDLRVTKANSIEFYYPSHDPARIIAPSLRGFAVADPNSPFNASKDPSDSADSAWWSKILKYVGIDPANAQFTDFGEVVSYPGAPQLRQEYNLIINYTRDVGIIVSKMGQKELDAWIAVRKQQPDYVNGSPGARDMIIANVRKAWMGTIYSSFINSPTLANEFALQQYLDGTVIIDEWDVPMTPVGLEKSNVVVHNVSVTLNNLLARLQLNMLEDPVHQHIGSGESTIEITMTVIGEDALVRMRTMFETLNGLASLEHTHAVLGFMGIKNVISALCGIKYCVPSAFDVSTVPDYPHAYSVRLTLMDFDIFQQRREELSSEQQQSFIDNFSKKNPFLRIQQTWGAFNAYPDFPLTVRDDAGKIVGNLDPDFYFLAWNTIDDDIVNWRAKKTRSAAMADDPAKNSPIPPSVSGPNTTGDQNTPAPPDTQTSAFPNPNTYPRDPNATTNPYANGAPTDPNAASSGATPPKKISDYEIVHHFHTMSDDGTATSIGMHADGFDLLHDGVPVVTNVTIDEPHGGNNSGQGTYVPSTTPASRSVQPYIDGTGDPTHQHDAMLGDTQYRDKSGRMIRAFPTYMLWLIDEGGQFAGIKMYDNFYGLQSVIDMSIARSEDIMADTLVLRLSNLYSRLSAPYRDLLNTSLFANAQFINTQINTERNSLSGFNDTLVNLTTVDLAPGVRVHLRVGYSANPNLLETVFNGVITQVEQGDIITITAQSDAIELSQVINGKNSHGDTGSIDGNMNLGNLWMSEPRDLMVKLLSMAGSAFKEAVLWATQGMFFSENKFGIRHFGHILYEPMTSSEAEGTQNRKNKLNVIAASSSGALSGVMGPAGLLDQGVGHLLSTAWANFNARRDYEIYKRNIYPGNGCGIAQYTGGDLGDGGLSNGFHSTGLDAQGNAVPGAIGDPGPVTGAIIGNDSGYVAKQAANAADQLRDDRIAAGNILGSSSGHHAIMEFMGLKRDTGDNIPKGYEEISFRAQTYMKTVWDIFLECSALLPNYIVAVRPFMDRSTVFYGKPHWLYTSGVIPISTGFRGDDPHAPKPDQLHPEEDTQSVILAQRRQQAKQTPDQYYDDLNNKGLQALTQSDPNSQTNTQGGDPNTSLAGLSWGVGDISQLPTKHPDSNAKIPFNQGWVGRGYHLPTAPDLNADIAQHKHFPGINSFYDHPFYMDRVNGGASGQLGTPGTSATVLLGESATSPGKEGAFGYLSPTDEQFYIGMNWDQGDIEKLKGTRILVYSQSLKRAVICTPGDMGPDPTSGQAANLSPDAWWAMGFYQKDPNTNQPYDTNCTIAFVNDKADLGLVELNAGVFTTSGMPKTNAAEGGSGNKGNSAGGTTTADTKSINWYVDNGGKEDLNPEYFALHWGWQDEFNSRTNWQYKSVPSSKDIPVDFSDAKKGLKDPAGDQAKTQYKGYRTDDEANAIWKEFRHHFHTDKNPRKYWDKRVKGTKNYTKAQSDKDFEAAITLFMQTMWQTPYNRGWVVRTADKQQTAVNAVFGDYKNLAKLIGLSAGPSAGVGGGIIGKVTGNIVNKVIDALQKLGNTITGGSNHTWNFDWAAQAFNVYITQPYSGAGAGPSVPGLQVSSSASPLGHWLITHNRVGTSQTGLISSAVEKIGRGILNIWHYIDDIYQGVKGAISEVINLFRLSIFNLTQALDMSAYASRQASNLNAMYNDSLYFNVSAPPNLAYYADNPFTREYGEPVIEIREPFQRVHMLNSWQHILSNGIIENMGNIHTVVTATSNGKHPVTVYFDKGAPSHHQVEKYVETGLYWDHPTGLSRFIHPSQQLREWAKHYNHTGDGAGSDDSTTSKRVALWHLKEGLKDIYGGELIVLGDPSIRPHDLCYMWDQYEKISGFFEVEQVVHNFTPEMGFITSITPNALVTINDPGKWTTQSMLNKQMATQNLRNALRHQMNTPGFDKELAGDASVQQTIINKAEAALVASTQFHGGPTGILKDLAGAGGTGSILARTFGGIPGNTIGGLAGTDFSHHTIAGLIPVNPIAWAGWKAFSWIRDNVYDIHGCYIAYLNKYGRPMDAGLSYNHGVAVGQVHTHRLLSDSLNIEFPINIDGSTTITYNDLLSNIGWTQKDIQGLPQGSLSSFEAEIRTNLLNQSQRTQEGTPFMPPSVFWVPITKVEDGDTVFIGDPTTPGIFGSYSIRFNYINAPELLAHNYPVPDEQIPGGKGATLNPSVSPQNDYAQYLGNRAKDYVITSLQDEAKKGNKFDDMSPWPFVAVRINPSQPHDSFGRLLATIFYRTPDALTPRSGQTWLDARHEYLVGTKDNPGIANRWPDIQWNSTDDNGIPYSLNYEMIITGNAEIFAKQLDQTIPDEGVIFGGGY